jgi:hypothetical protein
VGVPGIQVDAWPSPQAVRGGKQATRVIACQRPPPDEDNQVGRRAAFSGHDPGAAQLQAASPQQDDRGSQRRRDDPWT